MTTTTTTEKKVTILENGDGLYNTHVHLEDVNEVIAAQLDTKASLGADTKFTVIGDGNGFMSRVILVEADWTAKDEKLPAKFILKIVSCLHVQALVEKMKEGAPDAFSEEQEANLWALFENEAQCLHNREVNCYKILEKWDKNDVMLSPKIYFSKQFDSENKLKGFLGMEVVENAITRHMYANAKPHELHPVLKSLANLQAGSLSLTDEDKKSISGFDFKSLMGSMMNEEGMKNIFDQCKNINRDRLTQKAEKVEEFGQQLVNFELACNLNKYVGIERDVLVHGDLWAANILWNQEEGVFSVSKVIDYQLIHMGNPAEDLVRLFLSTLSGSDRQKYWEKLVEQFYDYFLDALDDEESAPYTLEQLKESYRHYFVTGGLVMLPMYGPIAETKLAYSNSENVEEYREILSEKAEHLLEDLVKFHLYSKDLTTSSTN